MKRIALALLMIFGVITAQAADATPAQPVDGYQLIVPNLISVTLADQHTYIDPATYRAHPFLGPFVASVTNQMHSYGFHMYYSGTTLPAAQGRISFKVDQLGCRDLAPVGIAVYFDSTLNDHAFVTSARIYLCPALFSHSSTYVTRQIRHEVGHAQGLGPFDGVYSGHHQVMSDFTYYPSISNYQAGDVNGLRRNAAGRIQLQWDRAHGY